MEYIIVKDLNDNVIHSDNIYFSDSTTKEDWLFNNISTNAWGKPDRWERITDGTHTEERIVTIEDVDHTEYFFPCEYTYEITDITDQHNAEVARESRLATGRKVRELCDNILDLLAGYNLERSLTSEQITQLETTFASIQALLLNKRPFTAKALIQAITPDETLVTTEMKSDILNEYILAGLDDI